MHGRTRGVIRKNREEFDDLEPSFKSWQQISARLNSAKSRMADLWKMAAVFLLFTIAFLFLEKK